MTQTETRWFGWFRPNKATTWTKLVEAGRYDDAWAQLLAAISSMRGGESLVLKGGEDPNRPAPRPFHRGGRRLL